MKTVTLILLVLIGLNPLLSVRAEWYLDGSTDYEFDDNLTNGEKSSDIKDDQHISASISGGWHAQLADTVGWTLGADLAASQAIKYDDLSNTSYGLSSSVSKKFGFGPQALRLRASANVGRHEFQHALRDGWHYGFGAQFSKRVSARWQILAGYDYEKRIADDVVDIASLVRRYDMYGDAFDVESHSGTITAIFTATNRLTPYISYSRRDGDVVASTAPDRPVLLVSEATTRDSAFGDRVVAYRIKASSNIFKVGLNWAMGNHASVGVVYTRRETDGPDQINYSNNIAQLNFLYTR